MFARLLEAIWIYSPDGWSDSDSDYEKENDAINTKKLSLSLQVTQNILKAKT